MADESGPELKAGPGPSRPEERRDSARVPLVLCVRHPALGGSFEERHGDLGVGGVSFLERFAPPGREVEVRFQLPGRELEARLRGAIVSVTPAPGGFCCHVSFVDPPLEIERAIARLLDEQA